MNGSSRVALLRNENPPCKRLMIRSFHTCDRMGGYNEPSHNFLGTNIIKKKREKEKSNHKANRWCIRRIEKVSVAIALSFLI